MHLKRKRMRTLRHKSAIKIQKVFRGRLARNSSFIQALRLDDFPRLFVLKEQKKEFFNVLEKVAPLLLEKKLQEIGSAEKEDHFKIAINGKTFFVE